MWSAFILALALTEPDTFFLGTGKDGPRTITNPLGERVNSYGTLLTDADAGATTLSVGSRATPTQAPFTPGDLILLLATKSAHDVSSLGHFELARIAALDGSTWTLTAPLQDEFTAALSQVVRIPELSALTLTDGAGIHAAAWDGSSGGVIALLVQGHVRLGAGSFLWAYAGLRGGTRSESAGIACEADVGTGPDFAFSGESSIVTAIAKRGRAPNGNAGGGGSCVDGGGGGGGGFGSGGKADGTHGGEGGAAITFSPERQLVFGGGGGGGHGTDTDPDLPRHGFPGGGAIFLRAQSILATGDPAEAFINASGEFPCNVSSQCGGEPVQEGGGGSGGGGTVHVRTALENDCSHVIYRAAGESGALAALPAGSGGAGGGGAIFAQAAAGCSLDHFRVSGGVARAGGEPGGPGIVQQVAEGFRVRTAPVLVGLQDLGPRPVMHGLAEPNAKVVVYAEGRRIGRTDADDTGSFTFVPSTDLPSQIALSVAVDDYGHESARSTALWLSYGPCTDGCLSCEASETCPSVAPVCSAQRCRRCANDAECPATLPVCTTSGACGECRVDATPSCAASTPFCDALTAKCQACTVDAHCTGVSSGMRCLSGACGCADDSECAIASVCDGDKCAPGCRPGVARGCDTGNVCTADGVCAPASTQSSSPKTTRGCAGSVPPVAGAVVLLSLVARRLTRRAKA
jgi:hypothetical protein